MQERRPGILLTHTASAHHRLDDGDDYDLDYRLHSNDPDEGNGGNDDDSSQTKR